MTPQTWMLNITNMNITIAKDHLEYNQLIILSEVISKITTKTNTKTDYIMMTTEVWIQDFGKGAQLLRPKVTDVAKQSCVSRASNLQLLEAFGFSILKHIAFSNIHFSFCHFDS